jgi:isocitrate dehydrogenase
MSTTTTTHRVTLIHGDGIGPEVTDASRRIIEAAGVRIAWEPAKAGAEMFKAGIASGVPRETIDSIASTRVALKGPLETPVGYGEKSANVTLRKLFELYANIRPCRELPGIRTPFSGRGIDLVVVRENVEDLYAGIEHMQTPGVAQCLKLISRKGCEKIARVAFELAVAEGRSRVTCATKSNIMKLTEGMLKRAFEAVAPEYTARGIAADHVIVDNCAHQLVRKPEQFDVMVMTNMNGDIISDLTSGLTGGLGLAPSANIGNDAVMFEAVHGSAPDLAGKGMANPTAMLLSAVMMLRHLGEFDAASKIEQAVYLTLSEGRHLPGDIAAGREPGTTAQYTDAVIANLGRAFPGYTPRGKQKIILPQLDPRPDLVRVQTRATVGIDLFVESPLGPAELGASLASLTEGAALRLKMISNRGVQVFPVPQGGRVDCVDHYRCRFVATASGTDLPDAAIFDLVGRVARTHRWMHVEKLQRFDGVDGYSKAQGED